MGGGTLTLERGGYIQEDGVLDLSNSVLSLSGPFFNYNASGTLTTSASTLRLNANIKFDPYTPVTFDTYEPYGWGLEMQNSDSNLTIGGDVTLKPNEESLTSGFVDHYDPGNSWADQSSGSNNFTGVSYGNGTFVTVGNLDGTSNGTILTSSDGKTWTPIRNTTHILQDVTYGNGTFAAVGNSGTILTSPEGSNCNELPASGTTLTNVTYANVSLWQWVILCPFLLHPMEPYGARGLLKQQTLSLELLTEMVPSWQWVREV